MWLWRAASSGRPWCTATHQEKPPCTTLNLEVCDSSQLAGEQSQPRSTCASRAAAAGPCLWRCRGAGRPAVTRRKSRRESSVCEAKPIPKMESRVASCSRRSPDHACGGATLPIGRRPRGGGGHAGLQVDGAGQVSGAMAIACCSGLWTRRPAGLVSVPPLNSHSSRRMKTLLCCSLN
jgi:hypothetical protein